MLRHTRLVPVPRPRSAVVRRVSSVPPVQVAVVGAGAAGLYASELLRDRALSSSTPRALHVDVFERWPVPFGLIRFGVAADHPDVKRIEKRFAELFTTAARPRENVLFRFAGNVAIGRDVSLTRLLRHYDAVLLAHGAESDRHLGISGERTRGVFSAREFVAWCNSLPDDHTRAIAVLLS